MHILSIYYTHKPGGFCKRLYRLLNALAAAGHMVHYLALDRPTDSLVPAIHFQRIPFPLKQRCGLIFWALFTCWCPLYLWYFCLRQPIERIAVFGAFYSSICLPARIIRRIPLVLFLRSLVFKINLITGKPAILRKISDLIDYLGISSASVVVCMGQSMRAEVERFIGRALRCCEILPNDVPLLPPPTSCIKSAPAAPLQIFTSGVLDARKNIVRLLEALVLLQERCGPDAATLTIAGDGPLLNSLKAFVVQKKIAGVTFLGWVDDLAKAMQGMDLVIHPSLHEGAPNSVLEALALSIPVIASDIPEIREILPDTTLLFDPHSPATLATKLEALHRQRSNLTELQNRCSRYAADLRFNWEERAVSLVCA